MNKSILLGLLAAALTCSTGCMTIHKAANKGNLAAVKAFLLKGTDVDARDAYGRTPLMYMVSDPDSVRYLLAQGADVNAKDGKGESVLLKASVSGRVRTVQYLKQKGAAVEGGAR